MRSGRLSTTDRQRTTRGVLLSVGSRIALVTSFELSSSPKHQRLKGRTRRVSPRPRRGNISSRTTTGASAQTQLGLETCRRARADVSGLQSLSAA
jgi:hypothetical protein